MSMFNKECFLLYCLDFFGLVWTHVILNVVVQNLGLSYPFPLPVFGGFSKNSGNYQVKLGNYLVSF